MNKDSNLPSGAGNDEPLPAANEPLIPGASDSPGPEKAVDGKTSSNDGLVEPDQQA